MENIIRNTTEADKQYLDIDLNKSKRRRTAREIFQLELIKHEQDAVKKGIPFARHIARQDFEADIKKQADAQVKKYGSVEYPEEIKVPKISWEQYSDLKNFKIVNEKEQPDTNLSNKNPGLNVEVKTIRYQYKDYENFKYIIMESGPDAIKRAVINRAKLDKQVAAEIEEPKDKLS